nr:MAG TPA: hypothetical protein [Caudoviricetes sp.]
MFSFTSSTTLYPLYKLCYHLYSIIYANTSLSIPSKI